MNTHDFQHRILSLTDKIYPMIERMLGDRHAAEDAVQEIMIKLWGQRKKLSKHVNVTGFVVLTARNYCIDLLKKKKRMVNEGSAIQNLSDSAGAHNGLEWNELRQMIEVVLKQLPIQQREVLAMRDMEGFEINEIADAMKLREDHVRVLLSRARKKVGEELTKIYSYEKK